MENLVQNLIEEFLKRTKEKTEQAVTESLHLLGICIDLQKEKRSRFKRIIKESHFTSIEYSVDKYYFNDGSENGLHFLNVVSTIKFPNSFDPVITTEFIFINPKSAEINATTENKAFYSISTLDK